MQSTDQSTDRVHWKPPGNNKKKLRKEKLRTIQIHSKSKFNAMADSICFVENILLQSTPWVRPIDG